MIFSSTQSKVILSSSSSSRGDDHLVQKIVPNLKLSSLNPEQAAPTTHYLSQLDLTILVTVMVMMVARTVLKEKETVRKSSDEISCSAYHLLNRTSSLMLRSLIITYMPNHSKSTEDY